LPTQVGSKETPTDQTGQTGKVPRIRGNPVGEGKEGTSLRKIEPTGAASCPPPGSGKRESQGFKGREGYEARWGLGRHKEERQSKKLKLYLKNGSLTGLIGLRKQKHLTTPVTGRAKSTQGILLPRRRKMKKKQTRSVIHYGQFYNRRIEQKVTPQQRPLTGVKTRPCSGLVPSSEKSSGLEWLANLKRLRTSGEGQERSDWVTKNQNQKKKMNTAASKTLKKDRSSHRKWWPRKKNKSLEKILTRTMPMRQRTGKPPTQTRHVPGFGKCKTTSKLLGRPDFKRAFQSTDIKKSHHKSMGQTSVAERQTERGCSDRPRDKTGTHHQGLKP